MRSHRSSGTPSDRVNNAADKPIENRTGKHVVFKSTRPSVLLLLRPVLINRRYRMAFRIFPSTRPPARTVRAIPGISFRTLWERYAVILTRY